MSVQTLTNTQIAQRAYESARRTTNYPFVAWSSLTADQKADVVALVADSAAAVVLGLRIPERHARFSGWAHWSYPPMTQNSKGDVNELKFLTALYGEIDGHVGLVENEVLQAINSTLLMDGTEQIIYEVSNAAEWEFGGGILQLPASAGAAFTLKVYEKLTSGGAYVDVSPANVTAAQASYVIFGTNVSGEVSGKYCLVPKYNTYGIKITLQQGTLGAGYVTASFEFLDSLGP